MKKNRLLRVSLAMSTGIAVVFLTLDLMARPDRQTFLDKIEASTLDLRFRQRPPRVRTYVVQRVHRAALIEESDLFALNLHNGGGPGRHISQ